MFNLKNELNRDFSKSKWGEILLNEYKKIILENKLKLQGMENKLAQFKELEKFKNTIVTDIEKLEELEKVLNFKSENLWDELYVKVNELKFNTWPRDNKVELEIKDEAKTLRDKVKKDIDGFNKKLFMYNSENANKDIYSMYKTLNNLKKIINEFEERFQEKKREKNIIDFHDIEHFALQILLKTNEDGKLEKTEVAKKIQHQYEEIAIDEYQDSNLVQEYILNSISNGKNIFMVGDVKQSIYKFRQARPELFLEKYEKYNLVEEKEIKEGKKIKLFQNFRSRKNILDLTNLVFEQIMSKELGNIEYTNEEYLNLGAKYEELPKEYEEKAELHIVDLKENEESNIWKNEEQDEEDENEENKEPVENIIIEAKFVANKIQQIIKNGYLIYDKKEGTRKASYKDIVILLRTTSNVAPIYEKELIELEIPVFSDSSQEYLDSIEIQTIMSVLKIIENPLQDIPLVTVLRSSIGNFTDNDLVQIRLIDKNESFWNSMLKARISAENELKNKINEFVKKIEKWQKEQEIYTLDELIWKIYTDSNYYNYVGLLSNGNLRQANLRMLFEKAREYETASFKGLYNFINFIDKIKMSSKDMNSAKIIGENDNVVRIMSIHKSKGLEFPIVFLSGTAKKINLQDLNDSILLDQDLGFGPKYINYERRIEYNTLTKEALKIKQKKEVISEEMRILYVALTRAREKLFITGVSKDFKKSIKEKEELIYIYNKEKIDEGLLKKYKSYLDWFELVYLNAKERVEKLLKIFTYNYKELSNTRMIDEKNTDIIKFLNKNIQENNNKEKIQNIKEALEWEYKYKLSVNIPTKASVSQIKEEANKEKGIQQFLTENTEASEMEKELKVPKFAKEEKISASQKGTLIHLCIKNLNEKKEYNYEDIKELIENLKFKKLINKKEAENIDINTILNYTKSDLFKALKKAKEIHKEAPFCLYIPAKEIYNIDVEEEVGIQGIIDLYFIDENNKLVLVDYKTDYVNDEKELKEKYTEQLNLYKKAIEKAKNTKVDKVIIYSLKLQKELELL